jgi:hypothetical protein
VSLTAVPSALAGLMSRNGTRTASRNLQEYVVPKHFANRPTGFVRSVVLHRSSVDRAPERNGRIDTLNAPAVSYVAIAEPRSGRPTTRRRATLRSRRVAGGTHRHIERLANPASSAWHGSCSRPGMAHTRSRRAVRQTIARIVALVLAPAACGGSVTAGAGDDGGSKATTGNSVDAQSELNATGPTQSSPPSSGVTGPQFSPCCNTMPTFDPSFAYGGSPACAPAWVSQDSCDNGIVLFPCGLPALTVVDAGSVDAGTVAYSTAGFSPGSCEPYCMGGSYNICRAVDSAGRSILDDAGALVDLATYDAGATPPSVYCGIMAGCGGRRPALLVGQPGGHGTGVGDILAHAAYLEAVSVPAFLQLARQLEARGAPRSLVARARRASADEVRHARTMRGLAVAYGGVVPEARVLDAGSPSLFEIAVLNASEGCVRETWGAACALAQSLKASDPALRRAMRGIARDELAHAALAWEIATWIAPRLTRAQRDQVETGRRRAIEELDADAHHPCPTEVREVLGLPSVGEARAILSAMRSELWLGAA